MRNTLNNPLVLKIRRHAAMTTLFKKADGEAFQKISASSQSYPRPWQANIDNQVVQASLVSRTDRDHELSPEISQQVENTVPVQVENFVPNAATAPGDQSSLKKAESIRTDEVNSTTTPLTDEKNWRRLQAILKRHAEAEETETAIINDETTSRDIEAPNSISQKQQEVARTSGQDSTGMVQSKIDNLPKKVSDVSKLVPGDRSIRQVDKKTNESDTLRSGQRKPDKPADEIAPTQANQSQAVSNLAPSNLNAKSLSDCRDTCQPCSGK